MSERTQEVTLVTGGTGFLGRALCERLQVAGAPVRAAGRTDSIGPWTEFMRIALPDHVPRELFANVDVVYHLAATAHAIASASDAAAYDRVNHLGAVEVARKARAAGARRFVFMSSVKVFGPTGPGPVGEDSATTADDPYGRSKADAEIDLLAMHSTSFEVVVLRPVLVYGPGAKGNLESLLRLVRFGYRPPLPNLHNRRSLVGLNDLLAATAIAGSHPHVAGRAYTVTDGQVYSTNEIIDILASAAGNSRELPFRLPMPLWQATARCADLVELLIRRRLPYDSAALSRLMGNAEYESKALTRMTGYKPRETLADLAKAMIRVASVTSRQPEPVPSDA